MKRHFLASLFSSLAVAALVVFALPSFVEDVSAIGIRPIRFEVSSPPGGSFQGSVTVVNETDEDFYAEPSLSSFVQNSEQGAPIYGDVGDFLLQDPIEWIDISDEPIFIKAGETQEVQYTVNIPLDAEAGGKYVLVGYQPVKDEDSPVKVNVRAASTLILTVEGDLTPQGEIEAFALPDEMMTDKPLVFSATFKNTGNIHVKPHGWIEIIDLATGESMKGIGAFQDPQSGVIVTSDKIPINLNKGNVLPDSIRTFTGEWVTNIQNGDYKAVLNIEYQEGVPPITQEFEFTIDDRLVADSFMLEIGEAETNFELIVTNQGSAKQKLSGSIVVNNAFGHTVSEIVIPEDIDYIAPGETKKFKFTWLSKDVPPGAYTATLTADYGYSDQVLITELAFGEQDRVILYLSVALGIVAVIALIAIFSRRKK